MKLFKSAVASLLLVASLALPVSAQSFDHVINNVSETKPNVKPRETTVHEGVYKLTVTNACLSENVVFPSKYKMVTTKSVDSKGNHLVLASFNENGTGIGETTGDTYQLTSKGYFYWYGSEPTHDLPPKNYAISHYDQKTIVTDAKGNKVDINSKVRIDVDKNGNVKEFIIDFPCIVAEK